MDGGHRLGVVAWVVLMAAPAGAQEAGSAQSVLVASVQGSQALGSRQGELVAAVRDALESRGYRVSVSPDGGRAVVDCQTSECIGKALDAGTAAFAIVPALWWRERGGCELTLTLVQRSGRNLNASAGPVNDLTDEAATLVDQLLARQAFLAARLAPATTAGSTSTFEERRRPGGSADSDSAHPHAWKAGPSLLIAAGAGAFVAVGVAAGVKGDHQRLNGAAVGAWSAIGAAAIAGGIAWWVVGEKRRGPNHALQGSRGAALSLHPTRIDLRLRF